MEIILQLQQGLGFVLQHVYFFSWDIEFLTINEVKMMLTLFSVITRENMKGL